MPLPAHTIVVSCDVFRHEIELLVSEMEHPPATYFMEMGLHENPDKLRTTVQEFIREQEAERDGKFTVLLAYGLCGQGLSEITTTKATLVLPKVHDCIPILLGVKQDEAGEYSQNGHTYWQSPGWVSYAHAEFLRNKEARYQEYCEKYGEDNAEYLMQEQLGWLRSYKSVNLIQWPQIQEMERRAGKAHGFFGAEARCFAREADLPYTECQGADTYLRALLHGDHDEERFLLIPPGCTAILSGDGVLKVVEIMGS